MLKLLICTLFWSFALAKQPNYSVEFKDRKVHMRNTKASDIDVIGSMR